MANTTWSTTDKTASVTLSGSNLIATAGSTTQFVRGKDPKRTGKVYFEITVGTWGSSNTGIGIANFFTIAEVSQAATGGFMVYKAGSIRCGNGTAKATLSARASGDIIGFAFNFDAGLGFARVAPSGNWNGISGYDPVTGLGGIRLSTGPLGQNFDAYPAAQLAANLDACTLNVGDTAFSGTVPSGYNSGWDDATSAITKAVLLQMKLEVWGNIVNTPYVPDTDTVAQFMGFP